jgi:hypothetical protein
MEIKNTINNLNEKLELVKEQFVLDQIVEDIHQLWNKSKDDYNAIARHDDDDERSKYDFLMELKNAIHNFVYDIVKDKIQIEHIKRTERLCKVKPRGLIVADTEKVIYGIFTESRKEIKEGFLRGGPPITDLTPDNERIRRQEKHIQSIADDAINVFIKHGDVTIKQLIIACPERFGVGSCDTLKKILDPRFKNIQIVNVKCGGENGFHEAIDNFLKNN